MFAAQQGTVKSLFFEYSTFCKFFGKTVTNVQTCTKLEGKKCLKQHKLLSLNMNYRQIRL